MAGYWSIDRPLDVVADFKSARPRSRVLRRSFIGFDYLYEEGPGDHSWAYWDKMIARTLTWLEQGC